MLPIGSREFSPRSRWCAVPQRTRFRGMMIVGCLSGGLAAGPFIPRPDNRATSHRLSTCRYADATGHGRATSSGALISSNVSRSLTATPILDSNLALNPILELSRPCEYPSLRPTPLKDAGPRGRGSEIHCISTGRTRRGHAIQAQPEHGWCMEGPTPTQSAPDGRGVPSRTYREG